MNRLLFQKILIMFVLLVSTVSIAHAQEVDEAAIDQMVNDLKVINPNQTKVDLRNYLETEPLAEGLPNWLASIEMSVLAGDQAIYVAGPVRFQVYHPEANDFIVDALESSGLRHSRRAAIDSVIGKLRDKLNTDARFYVHAARFSTYQYKTQEDSRELQRRRRRARK